MKTRSLSDASIKDQSLLNPVNSFTQVCVTQLVYEYVCILKKKVSPDHMFLFLNFTAKCCHFSFIIMFFIFSVYYDLLNLVMNV